MARYSKALTPAAQIVFLDAIRGGAAVTAAAGQAGVAVSTLYCRRRRDPLFDLAWSAAAELSSAWAWDESEGRRRRSPGSPRRLRFSGRRRADFLAALERDCNSVRAAGEAGVYPSTAHRHIRRDPDFARSAREALQRGIAALCRAEDRVQAEREARVRSGRIEWEIEPKGEITGDFDRQMLLLARYERPDGTIGSRRVSRGRMRSMPFEKAILLLARIMRGKGLLPAWPLGGSGTKKKEP